MGIKFSCILFEGSNTSKIVYEISKLFDFIEITLISGDFTDFIAITLIVKSRKCLDTTSANSDIFATCTCHVAYTSAHVRTCETSLAKPEVNPHFGLHQAGFTRSYVSLRASPSWFHASSLEHSCIAYVTGTCSKDIRVSTCGIQTFTRFYGNLVYCGLISDFSTTL